jgi:CheY-like chemotaxis protein
MTKILLVEDDKSLREIYGVRLLAEGYDIVSAGDGEAALAMAIKERPQLIVSDVMMPKISGFDMLDILRSTTETKDIKVIMMTALSSEDQRARGEALGADRYLVKSQVGIEDVVRTVHDVLADAPVSGLSAAQTFGGPAMQSPRPATTAVPQRPHLSAPVPSQAAPIQPTAPQRPTPPTFHSTPQPAPGGLPQPTAPFSTTRPANLGERVIHPIAPPVSQGVKPDLGSLMDQELNNAAMPTPPAPTPIAPTPPVIPQPLPGTGAQPFPQSPPVSQAAPQMPPPPTPPSSGISFEETPRPIAPPQPPAA